MELVMRVHGSSGGRVDVVADVDASHRIGELAAILAPLLPALAEVGNPTISLLRTGTVFDPATAFGEAGIVSGDDLVVGRPAVVQPVPPIPVRAVALDVLAGPDAGTSLILLQGSFTLGRDPAATIQLTDPTVSRVHADIDVAVDWTVGLTPRPEAENKVTAAGREITTTTVVEPHELISLGATRIAFRPFTRAPEERLDLLGQVEFHRTPYRPPAIGERELSEIPRIPSQPEPRRFRALAAMTPLAGGLSMFAFSGGQPRFLVMVLASPLMMVGNWYDDRKNGRHKYVREVAEFESRLERRRAELTALLDEERVERLAAAPDLATLARRAELRTADLWSRGRDAEDFGVLRLGLGTTASSVTVKRQSTGDEELLARVHEAAAGHDLVSGVPVTVNLDTAVVVGLHGGAELSAGVLASVIVQAACLHSPEDLTIVAAIDPERSPAAWMKWLPHARSVTSPLAGNHIATTPDEARSLLSRLLEVAEFRSSAQRDERVARSWPHILAVLDSRLNTEPAITAQLLDRCADTGIRVVFVADTEAEIPRQAAAIADLRSAGTKLSGRLWFTDSAQRDIEFDIEPLRADIADRVARALAPVRDASTGSLATSIPRVAPLLDVLGVGLPTEAWITDNWNRKHGNHLAFPVGIGADGPVVIDMVDDGPHALIGGTSGAGKSELLQSMVASLAAHHPPTLLNFLFVDYKGGASSTVFSALPHTVGYVTNLSPELSMRALVSLRAELDRRMRILEGRAKDLAEMRERFPDDSPPSLLIVVDEFATLVKEVPDFVAGVVDIAQRGRSLGIHLILATQRPSGAVNDNILANTNLRISLRMLDRQESASVIGGGEASEIPVPLRGRGYIRKGPGRLIAVQSAYSGAHVAAVDERQPILVAPFTNTADSPKAVAPPRPVDDGPEAETHLGALLEAIAATTATMQLPPPRRPWRDELPLFFSVDQLLADPRAAAATREPGKVVALGVADAPQQQDQFPALIDLESGGGLLAFGSGGAGKTTLLRTIAASAIASGNGSDVEVIGFDFASRNLGSLKALSQVVDVAMGDDLEAVTRHITVLGAELARRRDLLGAASAENLTAYNARHEPLPRILVLCDNFAGLVSAFTATSGTGGSMGLTTSLDGWMTRFIDIAMDGRQVGIHTVITADRKNAIPARLQSAVANRIILRHADDSGYTDHGITTVRAKGLDLAPGRGLLDAEEIVQISVVASDDSSNEAQTRALAELAGRLLPSDAAKTSPIASQPLPEIVSGSAAGIGAARSAGEHSYVARIGIVDVSSAPLDVDLRWSNFVIAGPPRSGRSSTLAACARALATDHDVWAVGTAPSLLDATGAQHVAVGRPADVAGLLEELANVLDLDGGADPLLLLVDDLDGFDDPAVNPLWERLSKKDNLRLVASIETRSLGGYTMHPMLQLVRRSRRALQLQPDDGNDVFGALGVKAPLRPGQRMPPGRGVLVADRVAQVVQIVSFDAAGR